jgi:hypothetical protein
MSVIKVLHYVWTLESEKIALINKEINKDLIS